MSNKEKIEEWENTFETAFLGDADNPEHIRVLYEALQRMPFKWIQTSGTGLRGEEE